MPELGRWNVIDQLAESYHSTSPYAYVLNNPIMLTDPDGRYADANVFGYRSKSDRMMMANSLGSERYLPQDLELMMNPNAGGGVGLSLSVNGGEASQALLNYISQYGIDAVFYNNKNNKITLWTTNYNTQKNGTTFQDYSVEAGGRNIIGLMSYTMPFEKYLQKYGAQISVSNYNFGNNLYEPSFTRDFLEGFRNADKSELFRSGSAFLGIAGLSLEKQAATLKFLVNKQGIINEATETVFKTFKGAGIKLGVLGASITFYEGLTDGNGLTAGDIVKTGIGLLTTFTPYGWVYGAIDLTVGITTGTTLTDRIGAGIDNTIMGRW